MLLFCRSWLFILRLLFFCSPFVAFRFLFAAFYPSFVAFLLPFFISCLPLNVVLLQVVLSVLFVSVFSFITNTLFLLEI